MCTKLLKSLAVIAILLAVHTTVAAQNNNSGVVIEALKKLKPLDPFKLRQEQTQTFDPQTGPLYFEDGSKLTFEKFIPYMKDLNYIAIPYSSSENGNVEAMLVRKSTPEEKAILKNIFSASNMSQEPKKPMEGNPVITPENASEVEAIKFDPNLKAEDVIKNLKKMKQDPLIPISVNSGRVPYFNPEGKLVPTIGENGFNKEFTDLMRNKDLTPDYYTDEQGTIKAVVYRKATLEERNQNATISIESGSSGVGSSSSTTGVATVASGNRNNPQNTLGSSESMEQNDFKRKYMGKKAPAFEVTDIQGNKISLAKLAKEKKVVVLNFWFTQCSPCNMEIPELNKLVADFKNKNVVFIALATNDKETLIEFFKTKQFDYKQVADCVQLATSYGVGGFPTNIILDKKSKVVFCETGYNTEVPSKIKETINKYL